MLAMASRCESKLETPMIWRFYPLSIVMGLWAGALVAGLGTLVGVGLLVASGTTPGDLELDALFARSDIQILLLATTLVSALTAGYVTARSAYGEELVNAAATGVLLLLGIARYSKSSAELLELWVDRVSLALVLPLAIVGALLFRGRTPPIARD